MNLEIEKKEDISMIIKAILEKYPSDTDVIKIILNGLTESYNSELLINLLKKQTKKTNTIKHDFLTIAIDVHIMKCERDCSQKDAVSAVSDKFGLTESTIRKHIDKFRKHVKENLRESTQIKVSEFIEDLAIAIYNNYSVTLNNITTYKEPERKTRVYRDYFNENVQDYFEQVYNELMY